MWTQTVVSLSANTSQLLIAANPKRLRLRWMVTGLGDVTVAPAGANDAVVTVAAGQGLVYGAAPSIGKQGGGEDFVFDTAREAFYAIANAASTVVIWEFLPRGSIPGPGSSSNNLNSTP